MLSPNRTPASPTRAGRGHAGPSTTRWASVVAAGALLAFTAGCAGETTDKASGPRPTPTSTTAPLQFAAHSGLWTPAQTCAAIRYDDAEDLATILSFMEARPPDMDHVVAAETVAEDFHELGAGTEGPLGEHLTDLAGEVQALIATLWEAGDDDWVVADEAFDMSLFDAAVVGLGKECPTPPVS